MVSLELKKARGELGEEQIFLARKADEILGEIDLIFRGR